jgi:hypothetical protein
MNHLGYPNETAQNELDLNEIVVELCNYYLQKIDFIMKNDSYPR